MSESLFFILVAVAIVSGVVLFLVFRNPKSEEYSTSSLQASEYKRSQNGKSYSSGDDIVAASIIHSSIATSNDCSSSSYSYGSSSSYDSGSSGGGCD